MSESTIPYFSLDNGLQIEEPYVTHPVLGMM